MKTREKNKSNSKMGLEPTNLRDLAGCYNHWSSEDSVVSEGYGIHIFSEVSFDSISKPYLPWFIRPLRC